MNNLIIKSILKINPNAVVTVKGNDINSCEIEWLENTTPIPLADIEAKLPIVALDMAMQDLRAKRNKLLADTDYFALSDNVMTDEVKAYRQALRDITEGLTTIDEVKAVVFPTKA